MDDSDQKLLAGCFGAMIYTIQFLMIGTVFIYAVTHW
jgi:hypothetical protein